MNKVLAVVMLGAALIVTGCGKSDPDNAYEGHNLDLKANGELRDYYMRACTSKVVANGGDIQLAYSYCQCTLDFIADNYSSEDFEKKGFSTVVNELFLNGTTQKCVDKANADYPEPTPTPSPTPTPTPTP